jgi:uncharacterized damage-inducible protein DinB
VRKMLWIGGLYLLGAVAVQAQSGAATQNAVVSTAQRYLDRYTKNLVGAAETMPAEKYGYKPTPAQMGFGETIAHVAEVNNFSCSKFADVSMPAGEKVTEKDSKEKLVAALKASFDYCTQTLAKLEDSKLSEPITFFGGRPATRATAVFELIDDLSDHYGQMSIYLRLNGLLPPSAQPKK